jgi:hypothetical protein
VYDPEQVADAGITIVSPADALLMTVCRLEQFEATVVTAPGLGVPAIAVYVQSVGSVAGPSDGPKFGTSPGKQYAFSELVCTFPSIRNDLPAAATPTFIHWV